MRSAHAFPPAASRRRRRGAALLIAILFGTIALTAAAAMLSYVVNERRGAVRHHLASAAFQLAEGGVEYAADTIGRNQLSTWTAAGTNTWTYSDASFAFAGISHGGYSVTVTRVATSPETYSVKALGFTERASATLRADQAVAVEATFVRGAGTGGPGYALLASRSIVLNQSGDLLESSRIRVGSYDSSQNFGRPDWLLNRGTDAVVGLTATGNNQLAVNNAILSATLRTGGGTVSRPNGSAPLSQQPRLFGPDTDILTRWDNNRVAYDAAFDFPTPTVPAIPSGWTRVEPDQNTRPYPNTGAITLGASTTGGTYIKLPYAFDTNSGAQITVRGDVILHLQRNTNLQGTLTLAEGARLRIYVTENASVQLQCGDWSPSRVELNALGSADVVVGLQGNFTTWTGRINAPRSNVRLHGTSGLPKRQVRGSVIAAAVEVTNGVDLFYDTRSTTSSAGSETLSFVSWRQIPPSEAPPTGSLLDLLNSLGTGLSNGLGLGLGLGNGNASANGNSHASSNAGGNRP